MHITYVVFTVYFYAINVSTGANTQQNTTDTLGRKAFEYSGARKDYDTKFGTEELIQLLSPSSVIVKELTDRGVLRSKNIVGDLGEFYAIEYYNNALNMNGIDSDYAQFQKAICYGLIGDERAKINELNSFLKKYTKSIYSDDAYFVLGNSYIKTNKNEFALESFEKLISNYNRSPLVSQAMLKKGLIYYNTDKNEQALTTYKTVVKQFPNSAEARQAIKNSRQIYVDLGRVDEYATWVKDIDFVNISDAELDNDMYESAEKQYLQNDHKKSILSFKKYLQNFPNGLHKINANFYLAQSLFSNNDHTEAVLFP